MSETAILPVKRATKNQFTRENAREMVARSLAKRKANQEAARIEAERIRNAPPIPPPLQDPSLPDPFYSLTLTRVRTQISKLLTLMESEVDGNKHDRLAGAIAKLEEIDRRFSDRSLPAVRRVQDQGKPSRASSLLGD